MDGTFALVQGRQHHHRQPAEVRKETTQATGIALVLTELCGDKTTIRNTVGATNGVSEERARAITNAVGRYGFALNGCQSTTRIVETTIGAVGKRLERPRMRLLTWIFQSTRLDALDIDVCVCVCSAESYRNTPLAQSTIEGLGRSQGYDLADW